MSTSLIAGIRALPAGLDGAVILLGDMPLVTAADVDALMALFDDSYTCWTAGSLPFSGTNPREVVPAMVEGVTGVFPGGLRFTVRSMTASSSCAGIHTEKPRTPGPGSIRRAPRAGSSQGRAGALCGLALCLGVVGGEVRGCDDLDELQVRGVLELAVADVDRLQHTVTGVHLVIRKTWNPFNPDIQVQLAGTSATTGEAIAEDLRQ